MGKALNDIASGRVKRTLGSSSDETAGDTATAGTTRSG
jgi:hypothetical protein